MSGNHPLELSEGNFEQEVLQSPQPVLVDFWAVWCPPCRMMAPAVDALAEEFAGRAKIAKLNVDENFQLTSHFGVRSIPTFFIFSAGKVQEQVVGATSKEALSKLLEKYL